MKNKQAYCVIDDKFMVSVRETDLDCPINKKRNSTMRRTESFMAAVGLGLLLATIPTLNAATYYVDVNYDGFNGTADGTSTRPYTNITAASAAAAALTAASDTFVVADGIYQSLNAGGAEDFGTEGIGFTGLQYGANEIVRGGYVGQVNPGASDMDWTTPTRVQRSSVVDLTDANARAFRRSGTGDLEWGLEVDGFTFRNGTVTNANYNGGVLGHATSDAPQHDGWYIYNCLFTNNATTGHGGAVCLNAQWNKSGIISNCTFIANRSTAGSGGALYVPFSTFSGANAYAIRNCSFITNSASLHGGAAYIVGNGKPIISVTDCIFSNNVAGTSGNGGAVYTHGHTYGGYLYFYRSVFSRNQAQSGSAVYSYAYARNMTLYFENCLLANNRATAANGYTVNKSGGAAWSGANPTGDDYGINMINSTVADNTGGGLYSKWYYSVSYGRGGTIRLLNSIVASNGNYGVYYDSTSSGGSNGVPATVVNNNVYGHLTANYGGTGPSPISAVASITADPKFIDRAISDYRLTWSSPCVNNGADFGIYTDLAGNTRPFNASDTGFDMGCYETEPPPAGTLIMIR